MKRSEHDPWLHRFAVLTALATLGLIGMGGLVTSHGAGMAVPDWPTSYGYNMFALPFSYWHGGIFYEHSHRLWASVVGLMTAILAAWIWIRESAGWQRNLALASIACALGLMGVRTQTMFIALAGIAVPVLIYCFWRATRDERPLRWLAMVAFTAVLIQGVLGGLRVTQYKDELGVFHGTLAQLFLVLICAIALFTSRWWREKRIQHRTSNTEHRTSNVEYSTSNSEERSANTPQSTRSVGRVTLAATILIFLQLVLGAAMRHQHAGLAIPDFPLAYGKIWPAMDPESVARYNLERVETRAANPITAFQIQLQLAHRLMAVVILLAVCGCAWRAWRRLGRTNPVTKLSVGWAALILSQAILGAATVWSNKAADIATLHVVVGAMSLVTGAMLCLMVYGTASHGAVAAVGSSNLSANRVGVQPSGCSEPGKC